MTEQNDFGARCVDHAGHVFMPRCNACESRNLEAEQFGVTYLRNTTERATRNE